MTEPTAFDLDTRVRRRSGNLFDAGCPERWRSGTGRPQGGTLAAQMMMAMTETVGDPRFHPRAVTTHFVRGPGPGDYEIECTVERTGRTMVNLSSRCSQRGALMAMTLAVFASDRHGPEFDELPMPDMDPPSPDRGREAWAPDFAHPFIDQIVSQPRSGPAPFSAPDGPMVNAGWIGFADPRPFDAPGLMVLCDAGMMPWWARLPEGKITATVDYTLHFRSNFPRSYPGELAVIQNRTCLVRDGLLDWDAVVWGPDGDVLCLARQQLVTLDQ